ncbi:DUF3298 and DUF4163 domain-containing protein [Chitinophaga japonensis]|nr:DUF3298 and DUF4163 domain-containing protein [Chitinophaga japonensis]
MNKYLLFLLLAAGFAACQPGSKEQKDDKGADSTAIPGQATASPYYYLRLKGTVGEQPVTMHLVKTGPSIFRGYYCYDKVGAPIDIWGSPEYEQQVTLYENSRGDDEITFKGKLDPETGFSGTWRGGGTSYPFTLKPDFDGAIRLDVFYARDSTPLLPGREQSPTGTATNSILWPAAANNERMADFIKSAIVNGNSTPAPQQFVKRNIDSFLTAYKGSIAGMDTSGLNDETMNASWNWTSDADMKVVWNQYPLLVLEYAGYEFTGGAHGNGGASYQVLDLDRQKVLKVADVFKGNYKTALTRELGLAFRKAYRMPNGESLQQMLMVDKIEPNDNFILTNKGVVFSYTPYEIGAYALGQISLFVPYERIREVLKEDYSK